MISQLDDIGEEDEGVRRDQCEYSRQNSFSSRIETGQQKESDQKGRGLRGRKEGLLLGT